MATATLSPHHQHQHLQQSTYPAMPLTPESSMGETSQNRRLLPKRDPSDELEGRTQSAPVELVHDKPKRKLVLSACGPCKRRKTKCDGLRPQCSSCSNKANSVCTWEVNDPSLSRTAALRSRIDELQSQLDRDNDEARSAKSLINYLMTRPEREAHNILSRLRASQDIAATGQAVKDGDLLIAGLLAPEESPTSGGP